MIGASGGEQAMGGDPQIVIEAILKAGNGALKTAQKHVIHHDAWHKYMDIVNEMKGQAVGYFTAAAPSIPYDRRERIKARIVKFIKLIDAEQKKAAPHYMGDEG